MSTKEHAEAFRASTALSLRARGEVPPGPVRTFKHTFDRALESGFVFRCDGRAYRVQVTDITDEVQAPE